MYARPIHVLDANRRELMIIYGERMDDDALAAPAVGGKGAALPPSAAEPLLSRALQAIALTSP